MLWSSNAVVVAMDDGCSWIYSPHNHCQHFSCVVAASRRCRCFHGQNVDCQVSIVVKSCFLDTGLSPASVTWCFTLSQPLQLYQGEPQLQRALRVQELCESWGGCHGLPVLMSLMASVDVKQHFNKLVYLALKQSAQNKFVRMCVSFFPFF